MKIQGKVLFRRKNSALPPKKAGHKTLLALATEFSLSEKSDRGGSRDFRGETPEKKRGESDESGKRAAAAGLRRRSDGCPDVVGLFCLKMEGNLPLPWEGGTVWP